METTTIETEKVFDISTGKYEEKPIEKPPVEEPKNNDNPPPANPENKDNPPPVPPKDKEMPPPPPIDHVALLKEKYGIDEAELNTQKESLTKFETRVKELEEQLKKPKEPEFASEQDKKAYEFIKTYSPSMMGEALKTYSTLIDMDVTKAAEKDVLKEKYILSKPSLSRDKAGQLFESDFKKYTLRRDDFDTDEDFNEAQNLKNIEREDDANNAREFLSKKQAEIKTKPVERKEETVVEPKAPVESVRNYNSQVDAFLAGNGKPFEGFTYKDSKDESINYNVKLPAETIKKVTSLMKDHIQRADLYDDNGKIPNFDPQFLFKQFLMVSDPEAYDRMHTEKVIELARTLKAEQIASTKPDKESKGTGEDGAIPDFTTQFRNLAKKEVEKRGGR